MMKQYKIKRHALLLLCFIMIFVSSFPVGVSAFKPASHYVILEKVAAALPTNSVIRAAIEQHKDIAAWGANGPDLGYANIRSALDYAPWADAHHYDRVGSLAKKQLQLALASGDKKKIAFAAGWVTHCIGDLYCHGVFVNPETGVYLDNVNTRDLHAQLENAAEKYVWVDIGSRTAAQHSSSNFSSYFSDSSAVPTSLLVEATTSVLGSSPTADTISSWISTTKSMAYTGIVGYSFMSYNDSINFLSSQSNRINRLKEAVRLSIEKSTDILKKAEAGDYSLFSDRWNLDAADDNRPIGTLTVRIKTGTLSYSGTNNDVYFGMELTNGKKKEWLLDKSGYDDFESGDYDSYYLYVGDTDFYPSQISRVWIKCLKTGLLYDDWYCQSVSVEINGVTKLQQTLNRWFKSSSTIWNTYPNGL